MCITCHLCSFDYNDMHGVYFNLIVIIICRSRVQNLKFTQCNQNPSAVCHLHSVKYRLHWQLSKSVEVVGAIQSLYPHTPGTYSFPKFGEIKSALLDYRNSSEALHGTVLHMYTLYMYMYMYVYTIVVIKLKIFFKRCQKCFLFDMLEKKENSLAKCTGEYVQCTVFECFFF